jgi:alpha,alpha-trehalose phosphorylase
MDLRDLQHNTRDRVHIASLAGTRLAAQRLCGLRDADRTFSFRAAAPQGLTRLAFSLMIPGRRLRVEAGHPEARYALAGAAHSRSSTTATRCACRPGSHKPGPSRRHRPGRGPVSRQDASQCTIGPPRTRGH